MTKLSREFYLRENVLTISRELLGKYIFTQLDGKICGGIIIEVEAYAGINDKASHAFGNRRTKRNEIMYAEGGVAYIYLCYGIHHLFNIVTNYANIPHAILLRAIKPTHGIDTMLERRQKSRIDKSLTSGPGSVSRALGITTVMNGTDLTGSEIWIEDLKVQVNNDQVVTGPRIGVDYAGEDAKLPYRFRYLI